MKQFSNNLKGTKMAKSRKLNFNHIAPDLVLLNTDGEAVTLSTLWAQRPLLLTFTRHFGCTQCKEMLDELVNGKERIEKAGLSLVIIMQGNPAETAAFAKIFAPGVVCLSDAKRKAYQAYGLERGNLFQTFLNLKVWSAISQSRRKGFRIEPAPAGQDAMQMSGTFIISKDGRIELPYYYDHIADHPPLDLLLSGVLSTRWDRSFSGPVGPVVDLEKNRK
jgi:peroxiredoxin